jgi:hypothetical protein
MNEHEAGIRLHHRRKRNPMRTYGRMYFDHLVSEYRHVLGSDADPEAKAIIEEILARPRRTWADLHSFERALLRLQPEEVLRRKAWILRDKFRKLAGRAAYENYARSSPPDPRTAPVSELRPDLEQLLSEFHLLSASSLIGEGMRHRYSKYLGIITFLVFSVLCVILALEYRTPGPLLPSAVLVFFMGFLGGCLSVQQRIQRGPSGGDSLVDVEALEQGWFTIYMAPISGSIFATVLYLMFIGGLLQGHLFPSIIPAPGGDGLLSGKGLSFEDFALQAGPASVADYAKLLFWSFVAGFAERLVPDTLDRIVAPRVVRTVEPVGFDPADHAIARPEGHGGGLSAPGV